MVFIDGPDITVVSDNVDCQQHQEVFPNLVFLFVLKEEIKQGVMVNLTRWLAKYKGKLKIPLWKILYNRRQEG